MAAARQQTTYVYDPANPGGLAYLPPSAADGDVLTANHAADPVTGANNIRLSWRLPMQPLVAAQALVANTSDAFFQPILTSLNARGAGSITALSRSCYRMSELAKAEKI